MNSHSTADLSTATSPASPITRILHVVASFNPVTGGPAEAIRNIILEGQRGGIESEIVCLDKPDAAFLRHHSGSFTVHALGHVDKYWFFSPALRQWLTANIGRFDTVIVHGLWLYPSYAVTSFMRDLKEKAVRSAGSASNVPRLLIFPHGMLDPYFQRAAKRRLKAIRNWVYWNLIEARVITQADALLFTCETELLLARQGFRDYQPKQEINVGHGIVSPPAFAAEMADAFREKCPQVAGRPYWLFLSRIQSKKGVDLLIEAYAALLREQSTQPESLPCLVIAGPGIDSPYGASIEQLVAKYPVAKDLIFFPGMLTGPAKWGALYGCQAFVLPSHQENFGIAVAEALACGKPVLISNQVNIWREVLKGGGGLIEPDTIPGTRRLLEQWLAMSAEVQQRMACDARQTFETYFRMDQSIHRLNRVLATLH